MRLQTTFLNLKAHEYALRELGQKFPQAVERGLYAWGEQVMTRSKQECPVDTGTLKSSGHVLMQTTGPISRMTLGYGGPAGSGNHGGATNKDSVGYAVAVHEQHKTKSKFLERPIDEASSQMDEQIGQEIHREQLDAFRGA